MGAPGGGSGPRSPGFGQPAREGADDPGPAVDQAGVELDRRGAGIQAGQDVVRGEDASAGNDRNRAAGRGGHLGNDLRRQLPEGPAGQAAATGHSVPIVACGGIFTPDDVRACLEAGAKAVQLYTGLIYRGPGIVGDLTRGSLAPPDVIGG